MQSNQSIVQSPCVSLCTLNDDDVCVGCYRHIDEITGWHGADDNRRQEILDNCAKRKESSTNIYTS